MHCYGCGEGIATRAGERIGFRESCARCGADLHCCRNCRQRDPSAHNECREPGAERVADRERANRCEWFEPATSGPAEAESERAKARAQLAGLFGKRDSGA